VMGIGDGEIWYREQALIIQIGSSSSMPSSSSCVRSWSGQSVSRCSECPNGSCTSSSHLPLQHPPYQDKAKFCLSVTLSLLQRVMARQEAVNVCAHDS
jgi:hypothetical protein